MENPFQTNTVRLILFLVLSTLTNYCFSQTGRTVKLLNFAKDSYKFEYPNSWRLDTTKKIGAELFIFSPLENEADKLSENVNIMIQDLSGKNIDLGRYKQITDQQVMELATDGRIFESSISKKNKEELYKITYAMTQGNFRLKITSVCYIKNDKAYLATFTSEFDKYDNYRKIAEQILNSFAVTKIHLFSQKF